MRGKIEFEHLKRRGYYIFGFHNQMLLGYLRSLSITFITYLIGGFVGNAILSSLCIYSQITS